MSSGIWGCGRAIAAAACIHIHTFATPVSTSKKRAPGQGGGDPPATPDRCRSKVLLPSSKHWRQVLVSLRCCQGLRQWHGWEEPRGVGVRGLGPSPKSNACARVVLVRAMPFPGLHCFCCVVLVWHSAARAGIMEPIPMRSGSRSDKPQRHACDGYRKHGWPWRVDEAFLPCSECACEGEYGQPVSFCTVQMNEQPSTPPSTERGGLLGASG